MQLSVVVVLVCHFMAGITSPVCREEIADRQEMPEGLCVVSPPAIAQWKSTSIFSGNDWYIARFECKSGDYRPKDEI